MVTMVKINQMTLRLNMFGEQIRFASVNCLAIKAFQDLPVISQITTKTCIMLLLIRLGRKLVNQLFVKTSHSGAPWISYSSRMVNKET